jgi:hypothetical protein
MAARNLPVPEAVTRNITIGANFATSPQGIVVGYGDTVNFTNSSGSDVTVGFLSNTPGAALYPDMNLLVPNGTTNGFTVPSIDCAANYNIMVNGVTQNADPYVIQVGNGPMYVLITGPATSPNFNPGKVAVPLGNVVSAEMGRLEMKSQVAGVGFPIYWTNDPFNPGITQSGPPQPVKSAAAPGGYDYSSTDSPALRAGGGKVIIQS